MRAVIQRVSRCAVTADSKAAGRIGPGLLVLLGVGQDDGEEQARYLAEKCVGLRIFPDEEGKMNRSVREVGGAMLVVSNFTLYGDCRKGKRPNFMAASVSMNTLSGNAGSGARRWRRGTSAPIWRSTCRPTAR